MCVSPGRATPVGTATGAIFIIGGLLMAATFALDQFRVNATTTWPTDAMPRPYDLDIETELWQGIGAEVSRTDDGKAIRVRHDLLKGREVKTEWFTRDRSRLMTLLKAPDLIIENYIHKNGTLVRMAFVEEDGNRQRLDANDWRELLTDADRINH